MDLLVVSQEVGKQLRLFQSRPGQPVKMEFTDARPRLTRLLERRKFTVDHYAARRLVTDTPEFPVGLTEHYVVR